MKNINKNIDPAGEVKENELIEAASSEDATGGVTPVVITATAAASAALCPTTKCSKDC